VVHKNHIFVTIPVVINHHVTGVPDCHKVMASKASKTPSQDPSIRHKSSLHKHIRVHKSCRRLVVVDLRLSVLSFVKSKLQRGGKIITAYRAPQSASPDSYPKSSDPVVTANLQYSNLPIFTDFLASKRQRLVELRIQIVNNIHDVSSKCRVYALWIQAPFLPCQ
jgi:hypothetical protein